MNRAFLHVARTCRSANITRGPSSVLSCTPLSHPLYSSIFTKTCRYTTTNAVNIVKEAIESSNTPQDHNHGVKPTCPPGVIVLAKMNKRHRFFLASKENYFGGHKVEVVMVDSGCNSMLLPLHEGELGKLVKLFPVVGSSPLKERFVWNIYPTSGVAHKSLTLSIVSNDWTPFELNLCKDLLSFLHPDQPTISPCKVAFLRFFLCTKDILLLKTKFQYCLSTQALDVITEFERAQPQPVQRKRYGLLGQALIANYSMIQHNSVLAIVDSQKFVNVWDGMVQLHVLLQSWNALPAGFNDLEDEDHGDADDDHEHYYALSEGDYYDE